MPHRSSPRRPTVRQVQLVGKRIRQLRKERRLTQTELSSRIGIQQPDLSRMEKGQYRVSLDTLFKILAEFDMGIGEFFEEMNRDTFTARDVQLVREFKTLPGEDQREVEGFIRFKRSQSPFRMKSKGASSSVRIAHRKDTTQ